MTNPLLSADKSSDTPQDQPEASKPQGPGTATKSRPARPPIEFLPLFRVLLHNDDKNTPQFVVSSIVELTPLNHKQADQAVREVEASGVGLLLVTHKERAELYQDQFQSKSLTVTIEPVE